MDRINESTSDYGNFKITTATSETRVTTMDTSVVIVGKRSSDRFTLLGIEKSKKFFSRINYVMLYAYIKHIQLYYRSDMFYLCDCATIYLLLCGNRYQNKNGIEKITISPLYRFD